jgi:hypothetical protein
MLDSISDTAFWSTSAEVIAGLVVAIVFADVAWAAPVHAKLRWYATLRWAALLAIAGGLTACLLALAEAQFRRTWTATVVLVSLAILGGLIGIRIVKLHERVRTHATASPMAHGDTAMPFWRRRAEVNDVIRSRRSVWPSGELVGAR